MTSREIKVTRKEVARFMRRLYERGLTTASGGNISARLEHGIFITPSSLDKGIIRGREVGMISYKGNNLTPNVKPSIENAMHLAIYKVRPDVNAIVHAHPPVATSFTAMNKKIDCTLIAEARAVLGIPFIASYALMGTEQLAAAAAAAALGLESSRGPAKDQPAGTEPNAYPNVILLENHGIVCLGKDLLTAFERIEVLESAAKMTLITSLLGGARPLDLEQLREIDNLVH
jgi:L-fuculose-phosphate aldolase